MASMSMSERFLLVFREHHMDFSQGPFAVGCSCGLSLPSDEAYHKHVADVLVSAAGTQWDKVHQTNQLQRRIKELELDVTNLKRRAIIDGNGAAERLSEEVLRGDLAVRHLLNLTGWLMNTKSLYAKPKAWRRLLKVVEPIKDDLPTLTRGEYEIEVNS